MDRRFRQPGGGTDRETSETLINPFTDAFVLFFTADDPAGLPANLVEKFKASAGSHSKKHWPQQQLHSATVVSS